MTVTLIDLLRHGEPVGGRRYRGQIDHPLSDRGWAQMRAATRERAPWTAVVSSPLLRCREFAEELAGQAGLPIHIDERLKEVAFGVWEGKTADEIRTADPQAIFNFKRDPVRYRPQGAEALDAFHSRVARGIESVLEENAGGHVLIVAHAGVIRMAVAHALGIAPEAGYRIQIGNAAIVSLRVEQKGDWRLPSLLKITAGGDSP
jgi:alpha-ribazole phosphatase/probable phosphoglycerate mutase